MLNISYIKIIETTIFSNFNFLLPPSIHKLVKITKKLTQISRNRFQQHNSQWNHSFGHCVFKTEIENEKK